MRNLTVAASFLFLLCWEGALASDDEEAIRHTFSTYWQNFSSSNFSAAGETVLPDDLVETKKELLPVFLSISKKTEKDAQEVTTAFFGSISVEKRSELTPLEVYASLNRFVATASPATFTALSSATVEIDRVQITGSDATVYYHLLLHDVSEADTEALMKKDGKWWLRVKENPRETAKKFRMLFP